jgi:taurine--2-oxoglutarate transaminase
MDELIGACKAGGLLPFANFNRIHVAPPLNISTEDARAGLEILDRALEVADRHVQD